MTIPSDNSLLEMVEDNKLLISSPIKNLCPNWIIQKAFPSGEILASDISLRVALLKAYAKLNKNA